MLSIVITEKSICERSTYDGLTQAILANDMPEIATSAVLDHYTNFSGYRGIMATQELQLAPVTFRLTHGELATFALEHGLSGYVDSLGTPLPLLDDAAADLFYTSFTDPNPSDYLWDLFGDRGNGLRLRFEVTPAAAQLRRIRYQTGTTLLKLINDALVQAGLPRFILKGVSRVGAFYLPMMFEGESETRLLAKRFPGGGAPVVQLPSREYWPIAIGSTNRTAQLKLLEVGVRKLDATKVSSRLPAWCSGVAVVTD